MTTAHLSRSQHTHYPTPDFLRPDDKPACREPDVDPDLFFPLPGDSVDEARAVCHTCPVEVECGEWAIVRGIADGIWGGLTPEQRKTRRRLGVVTR